MSFLDTADALDRALLNNETIVQSHAKSNMVNPKTLDTLQDLTFWDQSKMHLKQRKNIGRSCIVGYNISCRPSITWSYCSCAPLPLYIIATNQPPAIETDTYNAEITMAITKVITANKNTTKDHLILSIDLFG